MHSRPQPLFPHLVKEGTGAKSLALRLAHSHYLVVTVGRALEKSYKRVSAQHGGGIIRFSMLAKPVGC